MQSCNSRIGRSAHRESVRAGSDEVNSRLTLLRMAPATSAASLSGALPHQLLARPRAAPTSTATSCTSTRPESSARRPHEALERTLSHAAIIAEGRVGAGVPRRVTNVSWGGLEEMLVCADTNDMSRKAEDGSIPEPAARGRGVPLREGLSS